jgi:uncharacterized membrane protein (DUF4010 family)
MHIPYLVKIVIALLLGAAIGFERESYENQTNKTGSSGRGSLGVRSYALISLLGVLSGIIYTSYTLIFIFTSTTFILLLLGYYVLGSWLKRDSGITTELAMFLCFLFGIFLGIAIFPVQLIIALTVVLMLIMSLKSEIKTFVARIQHYELDAFISYALIALVVLPFLPNNSITLTHISGITSFLKALNIHIGTILNLEILNPFNLWRIVVIITGIDIVGYILEKSVGQKNSWLLTSIAGGFISSTSTTQSLAIRSTKSNNINGLVAAAIFANLSSFIQHFLLIASVNMILLTKGIPYLIAIVGTGLTTGLFFFFKSKKVAQNEMKETRKEMNTVQIFALKPALQFALIFTIVKLISKISLIIFGNNGFLITTTLASFTGLDAVTLSVGEIAGKSITYQTGVLALCFANATNLLAKTFYCFTQGNKTFALKFGVASLIIIGMSVVSLIFLR